MTELLKMCMESECGKILIEVDNKWIGKGNKNYQKEIKTAKHITYVYCPEHSNNNFSQRQLVELRRMRADGLM